MKAHDATVALVRTYIASFEHKGLDDGADAVQSLLEDRVRALATIQDQLDSFSGPDKFAVYSLFGILFSDRSSLRAYFAERVLSERDAICEEFLRVWLAGTET